VAGFLGAAFFAAVAVLAFGLLDAVEAAVLRVVAGALRTAVFTVVGLEMTGIEEMLPGCGVFSAVGIGTESAGG
jgi:hypothetical protein